MIKGLKRGVVVQYTSTGHLTCIARVVELEENGFWVRVITVGGLPYSRKKDRIFHEYTSWGIGINNFQIIPYTKIRLIDHKTHYTSEIITGLNSE